jgi:competence protein ComFC
MRVSYPIREGLLAVRDFLIPPLCPGCGGHIGGDTPLCLLCHERIREIADSWTAPHRELPGVSNVAVLLPYNELIRNLVHALKYHGAHNLGDPLGRMMALNVSAKGFAARESIIVPVPLHPAKFASRGYNQSERLAAGFAAFSGLTVADGLVERLRNTSTQTALSHDERMNNVKGAFRFSGNKTLHNRPVILIDDILTTGSTIANCAEVLVSGGAGEITVCVIATPEVGGE